MSSVEDIVGSLNANIEAVEEAQAQVEAVKALVSELFDQLQGSQLEGKAAAAKACLDAVEAEAVRLAGLAQEIGETRSAAEALRGG